jgi:hypothetical protein
VQWLRPRTSCFLLTLILLGPGDVSPILDTPTALADTDTYATDDTLAIPDDLSARTLSEPPATRAVTGAALHSFPLAFDAETVRLFVEGDSLRVEGLYQLSCRQSSPEPLSLLYPYPADSLMGGAHTTLLECRAVNGDWQSLPFDETSRLPAARWRIPRDLGPTLEVRTVYRQALHSHHARYIVTTTAAWGRPLHTARFEIHLPAGVQPTFFSYPFTPAPEIGPNCFTYEAKNFLPEKDVIVEWVP